MTDRRGALPAVHRLLAEAEGTDLGEAPHAVLVRAVRESIDAARAQSGIEPADGWLAEIRRRVNAIQRPTLIPVINATGVILHTNLGRAVLADAAVAAMRATAGYATVEYRLETGERGSRHDHVRALLCELTGAEDAVVVNNAAAAMILVLNTVAEGGETIVSRGELVEIGGAFRIPAILERSGTVLAEVGTTNRTRLSDYLAAVSPRSRCALKVHRSNFRLSGFTEETSVADLVSALIDRNIPVIHDAGSGLLLDLREFGLDGEPVVPDSVAAGAVTVFSGDKLLGGPQAGLVVGPREVLARAAANPFTRAMRPGKAVLAALQATLTLYRDPATARREIPTLAMLTADPAGLDSRARAIAEGVSGTTVEPGTSSVGGGSFPDATLPTSLVAWPTRHPDRALARLRGGPTPVIARADEGRVLVDPRTVRPSETDALVDALRTLAD